MLCYSKEFNMPLNDYVKPLVSLASYKKTQDRRKYQILYF